jgi:hypothetical protein
MAKNVSNNETLEVLRTSYNDLVDEVGGLGTLRTSQKGSIVDAVNSIIDQYFFFQDFEYDGSDGASSNKTFSGTDNLGETLQYSANRLLVFKNGLLLRNGTDYSATNGTSVTLTSSAANTDIIRLTSFTGSYEGVAGATQASTTQWTKTGAGSIYNHDTTGGVVINADEIGVVTAPSSGIGIQLEADGDDILLNVGGASNKVDVNGNLSLRSGMKLQKAGGDIAIGDIQGLQAAVRGALSASGDISYNNSTGVISFTAATAPVTSVAGKTGAVTLAEADVSFTGGSLQERVQDIIGGWVSGSGSTTVTYDDTANTLVVSSTGKTTEEIQDIAGAMFSSNTETGITATYEDGDGTIDLVIADATTSAKGIASFDSGDFDVSSGAVSLDATQTIPTQSSQSGKYLTTNGSALSWGTVTQTDTTYSQAFVDSSADAILRLTAGGSGSGNDDLKFVAGSNITLTPSGDNLTISSTDTNTQLTTEQVEDIVGDMVSGGTETRIGVTYDDVNGRLNFVVDDMTANTTYAEATSSALGLIKIGFAESGKNYPVELSSGKAYVNVPWTDTNTDTNTTNWNFNANGGANENISAGETLRFNGGGATTVSRSGNTLTISSTDTNTDTNTTYSTATASTLGLVKIGYTESGKNYPVELSSGQMYVNVPWSDTNTDTNTTYSAGTGMSLSGTTFSIGQAVATGSTVTFAEVRSTGNVTAYFSDDRLKTRLGSIKNPVDKVCALNGFYFKQNEKGNEITPQYADQLQVGVSAQEIKSVLPEVVVENAIEGQYDSVHYDKVVPLLIEAIKELKSEIESLKS